MVWGHQSSSILVQEINIWIKFFCSNGELVSKQWPEEDAVFGVPKGVEKVKSTT